jgi:hypothetical protein
MEAQSDATLHSARLLIDVLRDAIESSVAERARRRLLLLVDAIDGELRQLTGADDLAMAHAD